MRNLKHHEQKLLKKHDYYDWKNVSSVKKNQIVRRYRLSSRSKYDAYQKIVGYVTKLISELENLKDTDPFKQTVIQNLLQKLFDSGLIPSKESLQDAKKVNVSCFLRRRLLVVVKTLKFVETLQEAEIFIQQGHFMLGNQVIKNVDFFVPRNMEDYISWNDKSNIKKKITKHKGNYDDYSFFNQQIKQIYFNNYSLKNQLLITTIFFLLFSSLSITVITAY